MDADHWRLEPAEETVAAGFRFGACGAHTSRTFMLAELADLFAATPPDTDADGYRAAIVTENLLGKPTMSARVHAHKHLRELYGCDPELPIFRVLRRLWDRDESGHPLLALLGALGRDPVLRSTAPAVLPLPTGAQLPSHALVRSVRREAGARLNETSLVAAAQRTGATWTRAGHLAGHGHKVRRRVEPTPGALAFAVWLGEREGLGGEALLESRWADVLDRPFDELADLAHIAHRLDLVDFRAGGGVFDLRTRNPDPGEAHA